MARSTKGLYKRGNVWWITYFDALNHQRFESSKSSNKKDAEKRLVDRRKEAHEGLLPAPPIKALSLMDLQHATSISSGINAAWPRNTFTSPTSRARGAIR